MRRNLGIVVTLFVVAGLAAAHLPGQAAREAGGGALPGAQAVIDAAQYASLQAALDAVPETGGVVRLPPGHFEITEPLVIRTGDVTLEGAGGSTHIENINEAGAPALILAHPDAKPGQANRKLELWRIRLADFRITGNEKSGNGIEARAINEIFVDGVTISYHGGHGLLLDYCYEDPRISDSLITYNKDVGVKLMGCHDIVVSSNQFEENDDGLHCFDGFNLTMTGNNLDDHLGRGVVVENTYGSVLSGNMIEECAGAAIVLDRDCYGTTLSANVIAHNGSGIELVDAHGCAVSANTFTLMKTRALWVGPLSGRIAVSGNSFCNSYIGEGKVRRRVDDLAASGVVLSGENVAVTGNVFSSVTPHAVALEGKPRGTIFANNLLVDVKSQHEQLAESLVVDNLVRGSQVEAATPK